jgi:hypothetical protein
VRVAEVVLAPSATPGVARTVNVVAKAGLVLMLVLALLQPDLGNLREKGAAARAVGYPLASFAVPFVWWAWWRERVAFPWIPDLLVTITCFTDVLGNRMDLYDTVVWFDDWMHFMNTGLLAAAVVLLTLPPDIGFGRVVERALAFGATAAIAWELAEYAAFLSRSSERAFAYGDTLGDLTLGVLGSLVAAVVVHQARTYGSERART